MDITELRKRLDDGKTVHVLSAYGIFMLVWGAFEAALELGIMKQTGMNIAISSLVTSGLPFERRASILRSLLSGRADKTVSKEDGEKAISLINSITNEAERNHLIHGLAFLGKSGSIGFVKRITDQKFKGKWKEFTTDSLLDLCTSVTIKTQELHRLLGISERDLQIFSNIGLILAKKLETSPIPPDIKDSE